LTLYLKWLHHQLSGIFMHVRVDRHEDLRLCWSVFRRDSRLHDW
jgi:hypothetical protein